MELAKLRRAQPLILSLAVAAVASLIAVIQLGRIHPDEVYQFLEPAWSRVHGYGITAWEWQVGLRNWAAPIFISWILRLCDLMRIENPRIYRAVVEIPQWPLHAWMLWAVYRYAERRVGPAWAAFATVAVGFTGVVLTFGGRTMGESLGTAFFVVGVEALDRTERPVRAGLLGGAVLGLSVVMRYGSAALVAAALIWLVAARAWRRLLFCCIAGAVIALGLGLLDKVTWGAWFHSFRIYTQFNVLTKMAALRFGAEPWTYYWSWLVEYAPIWVWPGLGFAIWKQRPRIPLPFFAAASYVLAITLTAHKEARFLYPALVLLAMAAAPGIGTALARLGRKELRWGLAGLAVLAGFATYFLEGELAAQRGDQFRAIVKATRPDDVTGLVIVNEGLWGAGGYFYIGKRIPWLNTDGPPEYGFQYAIRDRRINRAVSYDGRALDALKAAGFREIDQIGRETILAR